MRLIKLTLCLTNQYFAIPAISIVSVEDCGSMRRVLYVQGEGKDLGIILVNETVDQIKELYDGGYL